MTKYRIRIWKGSYNEKNNLDPDEIIDWVEGDPYVWQDDPYYSSGRLAFDIHPEDCPATLNIYTNDSVRKPHPHDFSEWNGPVEGGLAFPGDHDWRPFGCEIWGRVMFVVEEGA